MNSTEGAEETKKGNGAENSNTKTIARRLIEFSKNGKVHSAFHAENAGKGFNIVDVEVLSDEAKDLFVSQSALRGESEPVEKYPEPEIVFVCNTASNPALVALFNAGWLVESLISQTLIVHLIRSPKLPFIQSRAAAPVILLTTVIMAAGIVILFMPLGAYLGLAGLPAAYFGWLALIVLSYILLRRLSRSCISESINSSSDDF